ncbi:DUF1345 domain-containing protein [Chitinophaga lutea]
MAVAENRLHPTERILISAALALIAYFLIPPQPGPMVRTLLIWDVFALSYLGLTWFVFYHRTTSQIRRYARIDDGSRIFVTVFILVASMASMFAVLLMMLSARSADTPPIVSVPVAFVGMALSWCLVHTTYTGHYAHLFYDDDETDTTRHAGGLAFPNEKEPDYADFAYFAFVIGMTFQVSDVAITSRNIRRIAWLHGMLSFCLNTFVVALSVSMISNLMQS